MTESTSGIASTAMAAERRVALCVARFYEELADKLEQGARAALEEAGIAAVFGPGTTIVEVAAYIRSHVRPPEG